MQADLFLAQAESLNLLPCDGQVHDLGLVLAKREADELLHQLQHHVPWQADTALIAGQRITSGRQVAWYADQPYRYFHSGVLREAKRWDLPVLDAIRDRMEQLSGAKFNSCVLNRYQDGSQGMGWHSDPEAQGPHSVIASLSLGGERKFAFKHKLLDERRAIFLQHGQVIVMKGDTQRYWLHAVMRTSRPVGPRISLTFRDFPESEDWT
ncbi:alpha-ketoglutarate-dependent dioxygenase AlkB [Pseudomonas kermanshahensis]|jgi:alkylated DNA repair dioxygenase AlkB|uniref:Alpha-ketoglutarate-dependent dioxygenase AlkB n=1 Tax=Pseudomonas kermanshahensis TaxID=2745482 RepID=A0ABU8R0D4_9PSED